MHELLRFVPWFVAGLMAWYVARRCYRAHLRDRFALAMIGGCAQNSALKGGVSRVEMAQAYNVADQMLEARRDLDHFLDQAPKKKRNATPEEFEGGMIAPRE